MTARLDRRRMHYEHPVGNRVNGNGLQRIQDQRIRRPARFAAADRWGGSARGTQRCDRDICSDCRRRQASTHQGARHGARLIRERKPGTPDLMRGTWYRALSDSSHQYRPAVLASISGADCGAAVSAGLSSSTLTAHTYCISSPLSMKAA